MLNNRERGWPVLRLDDPTRDVARRDRAVLAWLPVAWANDHGGLTLALRERENYLGRFNRNLMLSSVAVRGDATHRFGFYAQFRNPVSRPLPRTETSMAAWAIEGRAGAAFSMDRSLRRHLTYGPDPHAGFDAIWMATTDLGYVDRGLWEDAGTIEAGPWVSTTVRSGRAVFRARGAARAGAVYRNPGPGVVSANRYDFEGFGRFTGEASVRAPLSLGTTLGVRVFGGAYAGSSVPVRQRRLMIGGADAYETFTNPLLRSRGALFVRPDFHYHAPGDANLRGFRGDLGGRWAVAANVEVGGSLVRRDRGILRVAALSVFFDAGLVDTLALPSARPGKWYTTVYDAGVGLVTRQRIKDLDWTMRVELPFVVNRWDEATDRAPGDERFAFRWQVSLSPSF
jgi:hypothetical protein